MIRQRQESDHPSEFIRALDKLTVGVARNLAVMNEERLTAQLLAFVIKDKIVPPSTTKEDLINLCHAGWFKRLIAERYVRTQIAGEMVQNIERNPRFGNHDSDDWASP